MIIPIKTDGRESPTLIPCKKFTIKYHQIVGVNHINHREIPRKLSRSRTWKRGNAWRITRFESSLIPMPMAMVPDGNSIPKHKKHLSVISTNTDYISTYNHGDIYWRHVTYP